MSIIESLINGMMRTEKYTGKKSKSYKVVSQAFDLVNQRTKQNPVQIFIDALQNAAPREEITRLKFGGISVPKAVDVSPSRRLDLALRNICTGSLSASYRNKKSIQECLANELILASKGDMNSFSISKKEEMERVAASAR
jgi:small subunit ribosomal protein S7